LVGDHPIEMQAFRLIEQNRNENRSIDGNHSGIPCSL
jgi:hypothetical protein